jgi:dTDP-4-amino-4,6-dideoxygalactose transaminase
MSFTVPFVNLALEYDLLRDEIVAALDRIARTGAYILGPDVERFEDMFAQYVGVQHAISVNSGGDALFLSLKAHGIGPGDEIITAPNSFVASAWAIAQTGAKIVYADVATDYNIDPAAIESAITSRTRGVMPVHLTGRPARMNEIMAIAEKHNLFVVEDAAQAVGASYFGRKTGALGHAGCFSLHPLKNLHVLGDGGVITTNDAALAQRLKKVRNHGLRDRDNCEEWGFNSRLDSIQAAVAAIKLPHLDSWNNKFRAVAARYGEALSGCLGIPKELAHEHSVHHRFVVTHEKRDELQSFLTSRGVETKVNYPIPLHLQEAAKDLGYGVGAFPVAERLAKTILSLPIYAHIPDNHVAQVIEGVLSFSKGDR